MILTERKPEKSLYFLGSHLLSIIDSTNTTLTVMELYEQVDSGLELGLNRFLLTLDWLYMLGAIKLTEENGISICI